MDWSKFTDAELEAIARNDFSSIPTDKLEYLVQQTEPDSIGRQLGLTGRAAAQSLMTLGGLGPMIADPFQRMAGVQTSSEGVQQLLNAAGFPQPRTPTERVVQDVSSGLASTAGISRLAAQQAPKLASPVSRYVAQQFAENPQAQAAVTAAATAASGSARESGMSPAAQMGLGLAAGTMAPGGGSLPSTQRAMSAPREMVSPFSQSGREAIAGQVLNRLATDPTAARQSLIQNAESSIPNFQRTMAAAARDPGLAAAETPLRGLDAANQMGARLTANQQALLNEFRRISGRPGSIPYAETKRSAVTGPMREQAFENVQPAPVVGPIGTTQAILNDPNKQRRIVQQAMEEVQKLLMSKVDRNTGMADPRALYAVRKDIASMMAGKYGKDQADFRMARGELNDVMRSIDDAIEMGAPGYKDYMSKYAKISGGIDQMRLLQGIESKVTTGQPGLTGEPVLAASGMRRQLAQKQDELGMQLSGAAQNKLNNIMEEINRGQASTAPGIKPPGSDTFKNLSIGNLIGKVLSQNMADNKTLRTMTRPLDWLYKLPDEAIQQLLIDASLDPKLASQLMGKANMMTIDTVSKSLKTKAQRLGYGGAIGISQGAE